MSKKILLSALLISSFSFSSISAAEELTNTSASDPTVLKFTANSKAPVAPTKKVLGISKQDCPAFPFAQTKEKDQEEILIKKVKLGVIDPWFYQDNPALKVVSFEGSTIDLRPFDGHTFLAGCEAITNVSFKAAAGITLDDFIRKYASQTLLQRILDRKCRLSIDMGDAGATMANFARDGVVTQDAIHLLIKTSKILEQIAAEAKPRGLLATLTFGLFGQ